MSREHRIHPVVCAIGTTDPWNAAGLGLSQRVLAEFGVRPVSVVAAVSAQDARGVHALEALPPAAIRAQWDALHAAHVSVVCVGALHGEAAIRVVAELLAAARLPVIYDPVLRASRGGEFVDDSAIAAIVQALLPVTTLCTPNVAEAATLSNTPTHDEAGMLAAAQALRALGAQAALITGGHLAGDPVDVFVDARITRRLHGTRIPVEMRGTGCILTAGIAASLALGRSLLTAVDEARGFVRVKLTGAAETGGMRVAY